MQTQRGNEAATIRNSKSHSFSEKDALQARAAATPRLRRASVNTLEGWSSEAFLRQKAGQSFKKLAQKVKKETPGNEGHRWNSQRLKHPCEAQGDLDQRVRTSRRRSSHNTRKNGINESTKKSGPPRLCIGLWIICGPKCTQRSPITRMRNPLRRMASGMTKATSARRRHGVLKNKFAARMLVMKSTQLERIPLHACATSIVMFGS